MSSSSTTKLPPSNIGTGALYTPTPTQSQTIPTTSLRAAPIAHFASTPNDGIGNDGLKSTLNLKGDDNAIPTAGRLLAINSHYIAYAVKKGLIRIIHRSSGSKTLLRGHSDNTRLVDCAFFGGNVNGNNSGVGVMGVWDELCKLHQNQTNNNGNTTASTLSGGGGGTAQSQNQPPPVAASDVLATLGGYNDTASILIWRIHSNNGNNNVDNGTSDELGADKLLEIQFGNNSNSNVMKASSRIIWHPFNPNRFLLLHSNLSSDDDDNNISESGEKEGGEGGGRTVATLVETTKLVTMPYNGDGDNGGHMVCNFSNTQATGNNNNDDNGPQPAGTTPLTVYADQDCNNDNDLSLAGANDYTWSNTDARYVLTGHDDGYIRLWNVDERRVQQQSTTTSSIPCVASVNVIATTTTTTTMKRVTRVIFLSQYVDGSSSSDAANKITPPFITGTDMNRTITLWSSFGSNDGGSNNIKSPSRLRVFGLRNGDNATNSLSLTSIISVEMCPAPYRPALPPSSILPGGIVVSGDANNGNDDDNTMTTVPSSFLILAERTSGIIHALHMDTKWNENDNDATSSSPSSSSSSSSVVVQGFDYVSTLNVVHPIYSFCVAPTSPSSSIGVGMTNASVLKEERDVDLCCIQSKAVQMLTLSADMCAPPDNDDVGYGITELRGDLAPGVTLLDLPAVEVSDDDDDNNEEEEEEFEEEDYDMEEDGLDVVEYSTNDSGGEDDDEEDAAGEEDAAAAVPTASETNKPNAFSNWLGAIASPFTSPPPTVVEDDNVAAQKNAPPPPKPSTESTKSPTTSPPPGLGFQSVLPPPPPADMTPVQDATPTPPALLSPMQILSESGSSSDLNNLGQSTAKQQQAPKSTAAAAGSVPPPSKAAKKPTKKKGPDGKKAPPPVVSSNQPTGPMKILQREEPKEETNVSVPVPPNAVDINAIEDTIQRIISTQMKSHETQLLTSLRKVISTEVSSAVSSAVRSSMKDTSKVTEQAISNQVESGKLGKKLEKHAKDSAALAAKETVGKMQPAIVNSLHETMKEVMIPAYEAATRQMFHQTSTSLEKCLAQMSANHTNAAVPTLQAISTQMMKMNEVIQSLSAEVTQLRGEINTANAANENGANQGQTGGATAQPMGIRNEISASCQAQRYEEAFTKAVSASDGELVLFACKHADTAVVFAGDVSISQPILICLLQQLGAVLVTTTDTEDMKTILNWLQEIAVTIDPTNVNIQKHIGSVVQQLLVNINVKMSNCEPAFRRPLQTLMQVIRGLQ